MRILVTLTLLFFELLMTTGHAVPSSELQNAPSDVYEIQETGKPQATFTVPRPKHPTLREIVYYHVIERPYGEKPQSVHLERQSDPDLPQIEIDESMRPFTNGHGYQFADIDLHQTENQDDATPHTEDAEDPNDKEEQHKIMPEEVTEEDSIETTTMENFKPDVTTEITEPTTEKEISTEQPIVTTPSEEQKNRIKQRQFLFDRLKERYNASFKKTTTTTIPSTLAPASSVADSTAVPASTSAVRSKRAVNYEEIPLAPTLPPVDYSRYPGLRVYSGIQPMFRTTKYPEVEPSNEDDLKKAMKFKINDIFATMRPYDDDNRKNDNENKNNDIRVGRNSDGNDIRVATHKPEIRPKIYGMNLSEEQGYVFNNMWRPMNYRVGEPVKLYEVNEYEVSTIEPVEQDTTTEAKTTTSTTTTTTPNPKDMEDIFIDVKKEKVTTTTTVKPDIKPNKENKSEIESKKEKKDPSDNGEKEDGDHIASKSLNKKKKKPQAKPNNEEKPDLYEQLMNSDKFWKWLAQWTSNYMEVLSDRVKDMVKEEVAKEIKKYENAHQNITLDKTKDEIKPNNLTIPAKDEKGANKTEIASNKEPVIKNNTLIIDGKKIPITNTTNLDKGNDSVKNDFLRKHRDDKKRPNKDQLTTNDKLDDKKENVNKNTTETNKIPLNATKYEENYNNVKAHNVYGSATGNDKVTNIFIFYPGTEAEKIIDGLKPYLNNSVTGIATAIKNDKKIDMEEKKDEKLTEKRGDTTTIANKEPENITTQKPIENNNKTEENKPVGDKNSTKLEANKGSNINSTEVKIPDSQDKKGNVTEKNKETTEKATEKVETSSEMPKSSSTEVSTEKKVDSTTIASTPSTSKAPINANATSLVSEANSNSSTKPTVLTH